MNFPKISSSLLKLITIGVIILFIMVLQPNSNGNISYRFEEGKIWFYETVKADFDFPIYKLDTILRLERAEALKKYAPCFTPIGTSSTPAIVSLKDMRLIEEGNYDYISVVDRKHRSKQLSTQELLTPKALYEQTGREMLPNLVYDSLISKRLYDNILESVSPTEGAILRGQTIIEHGATISNEDYRILLSWYRALSERAVSKEHQWVISGCFLALTIVFILLFVVYLLVFRRALWEKDRDILFFAILLMLMVGTAMLLIRYIDSSLVYIIPFAWTPILVRVFYDSRTAFMLHLTTVLLVSLSVPDPHLFLLLQIPVGLVAIDALKDLTRRSQLAITAIYIFLTYSAIYTLYFLMYSGDISKLVLWTYVYFLINAVLIISVYSLIYIFEKVFRLVSSITLVELSDVNSDLMQKFASEAPGTFQHSLQVSNLASDAAKTVGAKALLVRTGALYHDIGKMANPQWYVENQSGGQNPLLEMSNRDAAKAVIDHVVQGEMLAHKYHLPLVITNFITSHHGTSLVRYFYHSEINKVRKENIDENSICIADFQYPGPKPTTKEGAILMMADAVEARSRTLSEYTKESIKEMIEQMIGAQIQDGQLSETPLSFHDLERIKESFLQRLLTIYHHRISYPKIEERSSSTQTKP